VLAAAGRPKPLIMTNNVPRGGADWSLKISSGVLASSTLLQVARDMKNGSYISLGLC